MLSSLSSRLIFFDSFLAGVFVAGGGALLAGDFGFRLAGWRIGHRTL
jgi:hypothetical protein